MTAEAVLDGEVRYRLVLPPGWTRLPMEPVALRPAARAWLLARSSTLPRDRTAQARRAVEDDLVALASRPGAEYARMLLVLSVEAQSRPVSASCLVSELPLDLSDETRLEAVRASREAGTVACAVTDVGPHRALVVVRDEVVAPPAQDEAETARLARAYADHLGLDTRRPDPEPSWDPRRSRSVGVHLPVPDTRSTLLLSFSTPLAPLFDPLTELFLLMAATVQWRRDGERWS